VKHLNDTPVLVLGLGASGLAMARWCARHGARVTVADTREAPPQLATLQRELPGVAFVGGAFSSALIDGTAIRAVYRSPGLSPAEVAPVVDAARAAGLPVGGELDLFARALHDLRTVETPAAAEEAAPAQGELALEATADAAPALEASAPETTPGEHAAQAAAPPAPAADIEAAPSPEAAAVQDDVSTPVDTAEPVAEPATPAEPSPDEEATLPRNAALDAPRASTLVTAPQPGQAYVPTAAKEAAAFVARIAELSAATAAADAQAAAEAAQTEPAALPVVEAPKGYTPAVIAVTGTNGKTTVTALTGQLIERAGKTVAVAGNIGPTLLDTLAAHIDGGTLPDAWVLELSSFQLDGVQGFEPTAAAVLNITQDHLDWHGDMAAYAAAKARVFGAAGLMVLNRDDAAVMALLSAAGPSQGAKAPAAGSAAHDVASAGTQRRPPVKVRLQRPQVRAHVTFGAGLPQRPGDFGIERLHGMTWLVRAHEADETLKRKRGAAVEAEEIQLQRLMPADALRIRGQHNALNALAALALASAAGCPIGPMLYGLREYRGEPHRVEPVAMIDDVEYFDDSKGTNVGATVAALNGLGVERRVVVILGGEGKGQDFSPLAEPVARYARAVVLMGRDAPLIEAALDGAGVSLLQAASMADAVTAAAGRARPGDAVLLSPACASFDMFRDYAHRAAVFCEAVQALADEPRAHHGEFQ